VPAVTLLRHGAHRDVGERLTGRALDCGLTDAGRAQVVAAAKLLKQDPPAAIYSSPRRRTLETSEIMAERFGLTVTTSEALDEIDFGEWTGLTFEQLDADPRWEQWNAHRSEAECPGGERQPAAQARALAFAFEAAAKHDTAPLLVSHCDIIRSLVCWAERRSLDDIHAVSCEPASLTALDLSPGMADAA